MDPSRVLSGLLSSIVMGGVGGFIFFFILAALGIRAVGPVQVGIAEATVAGAVLGLVLQLLGELSR